LNAILATLGSRREESISPSGLPARGRRLRVLLAEDNVVNRRLIQILLEAQGHQVTMAENGLEAVERVKAETFDLVLMDVQMPGMDGLVATGVIRESERGTGAHLPIVGVTAHAMKGDRERCLEAGMDGYVSKPIRPALLFEAMEEVMRKGVVAEAANSPAPPGGVILDETSLFALVSRDQSLLNELVSLFQEDGPRRLAEMNSALAAGDLGGLRRAAHTLTGASGTLCGRRTAAAARRLEELAEAGDVPGSREQVAVVRDELSMLSEALLALTVATRSAG
jgi:CheY-like chemotaxis protein